MANEKFDPRSYESRWQQEWDTTQLYKTQEGTDAPKYYVLDMFPYPSGSGLHVGHPKGYIATDIIARMKAMQGYSVLHPMGWDAFGLPAENYAIKNQVHPRVAVDENIRRFKSQLRVLGLTYDWNREIDTTDPKFHKWTQWIFLQMLQQGLAYESYEPINWCPSCQTGLANEDLEDGKCERCGSEVERKPMRQWVLGITEYADRLLDDLEKLPGWEESIKEMQRNWIGRKEGARISFPIRINGNLVEDGNAVLEVFTTRPDTLAGCTYAVIAPEHKLVQEIIENAENPEEIMAYVKAAANKTDLERTDLNKDKTGVQIKGLTIVNPVTHEEVPVYVADYVLANYGTGAIMAVPAHDQRDYEFAQKHNLPIKVVVAPEGVTDLSEVQLPYTGEGVVVNSGVFDGVKTEEAKENVTNWLDVQRIGGSTKTYRLQDWVFSRQRYWGEPIPVVHCEKCGVVPVPEDQLPVELPDVESYQPTGTGESPLAGIEDWVNTTCPTCDGPAKRETNTMPQWAGSSWYWLRYIDPTNGDALVASDKEAYWSPVDQYVGGAEHATRHLIYARFWYKFLYDIGVVNHEEPFTRLQHVGLIMGPDGRKMSKRFGNVINPDDVVEEYGADALRMYEMFMGPFNSAIAWDTKGLIGVWKFLEKVWNLQHRVVLEIDAIEREALEHIVHKTIKQITEDIDAFKFNTAVSKLMILVNSMLKQQHLTLGHYKVLLQLLHPFAPHISEELWGRIGEDYSIYNSEWPQYDNTKLELATMEIGVVINGKPRGKMTIERDQEEESVKEAVLQLTDLQKFLDGKQIEQIRYVPGRLVSIVAK